MKEEKPEQHKIHRMTLDIMSGFKFFWGIVLGVLSLAFFFITVLTVAYVILLIAGRF